MIDLPYRRSLGVIGAVVLLWPGAVLAAPYWIAYEGNDFPENEGWTRVWGNTPAQRWIEDGALVIDSREDPQTYDYLKMEMPGTLDPGPGEVFVMRWRLKVEEVIGVRDPGTGVSSDEKWAVGFEFSESQIKSVFENNVTADFEPGVFHEFEFRSKDMRAYELFIDGDLAIEGSFWDSLTEPRVGWGDVIQGGASLARWDYFEFGVVPEPRPHLVPFDLQQDVSCDAPEQERCLAQQSNGKQQEKETQCE